MGRSEMHMYVFLVNLANMQMEKIEAHSLMDMFLLTKLF